MRTIIRKISEWIRSSLSKKMIIVFSIVSTLLVLCLIYVSYTQTFRLFKEDFILNTKENLNMSARNFEGYMDSINEISILLSRDSNFMSDLSFQNDSFTAETYRNNQLRNLLYSRKDIEKISFFTVWNMKEYVITKASGQVDTRFNDQLLNQEWYQRLDENKHRNNYVESAYELSSSQKPADESSVFLSYHRKLINIQDKAPLGVLSIHLNDDEFNKIFNAQHFRYNEVAAVLDDANKLIYVNDETRTSLITDAELLNETNNKSGDGDFQIKLNHQEYIGIFNKSENENWKLIKLTPVESIDEVIRKSTKLSLMIGIVFVILFIIITIIVSNAITGPLRKLTRKMRVVSTGNFNSTFEEIDGIDEIAKLSRTFNLMLANINELINEKYKAKLGERNAQLKALESQINPHFMYNTLQAISTEAMEYDATKVTEMIDALAKILRYCFNESEKVTLENEVDNVMKYMMLIQARFEDQLFIQTSIEHETKGILIPKLSIQTVVENAIKHAFEQISDNMSISLETYCKDRTLEIKISDNGPGIESSKLKRIIEGFKDDSSHEKSGISSGIGLKNLYSRLKLMYGETASLYIESIVNEGTLVHIIIPLEDDKEVFANGQSVDY